MFYYLISLYLLDYLVNYYFQIKRISSENNEIALFKLKMTNINYYMNVLVKCVKEENLSFSFIFTLLVPFITMFMFGNNFILYMCYLFIISIISSFCNIILTYNIVEFNNNLLYFMIIMLYYFGHDDNILKFVFINLYFMDYKITKF
jgi:hypothetical protein